MLKVLIAAGGSGGHLFPAQQLAELLQKDSEVVFAGHLLSQSPFFAGTHFAYQEILAAPPTQPLRFLSSSCKGLWQSLSFLRKIKPDVVVGFGSFHTFPVLLAAVLLRKKIILFEANTTLGKVNRLFAPLSAHVAWQFPQGKGVTVPFLPWAKAPAELPSARAARKRYGLDPALPTVLVFGGSQGAAFLNERVPKAVAGMDVQVLHLTGKGTAKYDGVACCVKPFEKEMHWAYAAADVVVCRSGAGTIAELIRYEKPALLIPFPRASEDHQRKNGEFLAHKIGGALLLAERAASPSYLAAEIAHLFREEESLRRQLRAWKQKLLPTKGLDEWVRKVGQK